MEIRPRRRVILVVVPVWSSKTIRWLKPDRLARRGPFLARLLDVGPIMLAGPQSFLRNIRPGGIQPRLAQDKSQRLRATLKIVQDALSVAIFVVCGAGMA